VVRPSKNGRTRGHLGRGTLASLLLHLHLLVPLLIVVFIRAGHEEAERAEEVDIGFEKVEPEQLPADLPPLDDTPPPAVKDARTPKTSDRRAEEEKKKPPPAPAPAEPEKKVAETPPPTPSAPPAPAPPPPVVPEKREAHEKIVDLDNDKTVEPPPNAKYLAQKNSRTEEETRATHTNLEREQKEGETSASSAKPAKKQPDNLPPGDDHEKVAELEDQPSKLGRKAPSVVPQVQPEALPPPEPRPSKSPVLSLRESLPRSHEITPETVDPSLPHDPAGLLARERPKTAFRDAEGGRLSQGQRVKLAMAGKDYEVLFGAEAKADRQLAQKQRSSHLGSQISRRLAQVRSALENFIPEVKPGTRTVVNARAAPFAAFIARVHRQIHKFWGFGVLEDWDGLPGTSPFNDDKLMTTLEIVLNDNGTVNKIAVVKASGYMAYDAAAIDAVLAAAPFPEPPRDIVSNNGKIYFHWNFARDGRACGTEGVRYFILDNAPADRSEAKHG
jgi:TonB family protein